jgi:hypothetical protein
VLGITHADFRERQYCPPAWQTFGQSKCCGVAQCPLSGSCTAAFDVRAKARKGPEATMNRGWIADFRTDMGEGLQGDKGVHRLLATGSSTTEFLYRPPVTFRVWITAAWRIPLLGMDRQPCIVVEYGQTASKCSDFC